MTIDTIVAKARATGRHSLSEPDGKLIVASAGIHIPKSAVASTIQQAETLAKSMSGPFAVKVISQDIIHKSDAGGVAININDYKSVSNTIKLMSSQSIIKKARVDGWLIEEMAPQGHEFAIGGINDPCFGPMMLVGIGGILIELLKDTSLRSCPITEFDAKEMLSEIKFSKIFDGVRGAPPINPRALIDVMLRFGGAEGLFFKNAELFSEIDINPIIVSKNAAIAVDARFIISNVEDKPLSTSQQNSPDSVLSDFKPLFQPDSVAVLGASSKTKTIANTFIQRLRDFGYPGRIYPIHPAVNEIEGYQTYADLNSTPEVVDYAYIAIKSDLIPDILAKSGGHLRFAQVISAGFAEVREGVNSQIELVQKAQRAGVRVLGPNCLGTYSPRGGLTFPVDAPKETGVIGVISQSGGLSTDIIKRGQWRGLRFSGLVTIGNSADVTPSELMEFYFADPRTKAIGLYLEDVKDGPRFVNLLRSPSATKPVVILVGGQSNQGKRAAASHTGALTTTKDSWQAIEKQTSSVVVTTINAFIDVLLALQNFELRPKKPTQNIVLFGNGGGSSVLGADTFAHHGLIVSPFNNKTLAKLEALKLPPGTGIENPVDTPVRTLQERNGWVAGEILNIIYGSNKVDAIAMHLNLASFVGRGEIDPIDNLLKIIEQAQIGRSEMAHFCLALRTDGSPELDDARRKYRERARQVNVPVYDEIPELAFALSAVSKLENKLSKYNT